MKRQKPLRDNLSQFRAAVDADGGLDPRDFFKKHTSARGPGRKTQQLCGQVAETIRQLLGEAADPIVQSLELIEVVPAPDASQFLILVAPMVAGPNVGLDDVAAALARASGWLRSEIATAITRKRAPQLVFRVLPGPATKEAQS